MKIDPRITELAGNIVNYAWDLKKGEVFYVDMIGPETRVLGQEIVRLGTLKGGVPFWHGFDDNFAKAFFSGASLEQHKKFSDFHRQIMERVDCYVGVRGGNNPYDMSDLSSEQRKLKDEIYQSEVHMKTRLKKRWVVLRYPVAALATMARMSQEKFEDFYFQVCCFDYAEMSRAMDPRVALMQKTDRVRIVSPGTDIEFSIKGLPAIKCDGRINIPDGEVFTAPVKNSVNGFITYNTTSLNRGLLFRDIRLEVKDGKIIRATAPAFQKELDEIFNMDEGARYFGEFAIGVNPYILEPMNDTLFDEKIKGSIHLTPGNSYDECDNGNKSSVHWDLVLIQRESHGGGELYFDGKLVRKNGVFIVDELKALNFG